MSFSSLTLVSLLIARRPGRWTVLDQKWSAGQLLSLATTRLVIYIKVFRWVPFNLLYLTILFTRLQADSAKTLLWEFISELCS